MLKQLHAILVECAHRFPVPLYGNEGKKQDKFILTAAPEQLKCVVTLTGDSITHAVGIFSGVVLDGGVVFITGCFTCFRISTLRSNGSSSKPSGPQSPRTIRGRSSRCRTPPTIFSKQ